MKTNDKTFDGVWWVPSDPDKRYYGTLKLDNSFELHLIDGEYSIESLIQAKGVDSDIIVGQSLGKSITLLGCRNVGVQSSTAGIAQHYKVHVSSALLGDHFESEDKAKFNLIEFQCNNLNAWCARFPIAQTHNRADHLLTYKWPETLSATLPGGTVDLANHLMTSDSNYSKITWESRETLKITLKRPQSLSDIGFKYIGPLRQFLTLASGTHTTTTSLRVANSRKLSYSKHPIWSEVQHYGGKQALPDPEELSSLDMRFTLIYPEMDFGKIIPKWMRLHKQLKPDLDLLFSLNSPSGGYTWNSLFNVASATEGMHRRLYPRSPERMTFRNRLLQLLGYASPLITEFVGDKDKWATIIKNQRNEVGHSLGKYPISGEELLRLTQTTQLLLHIVILRKLGFTKKQCKQVVMRDNEWAFLKTAMPKTFPDLFV
jgi:hypothetical protein